MVKTHSLQSGCSMRLERGFTLVEILISVVVSSLAIATLYASYDIIQKQYSKIRDVTVIHQGGRNILEMIKRDVRMAGFVYRDTSGKITYGGISEPVKVTDSGNKCCDDITVTYDYQVQSATTQRLRIKYWVESYRGSKGTRGRLYKRTDVLAPNVVTGKKEPMADYIEDLQFTSGGDTGMKWTVPKSVTADGNKPYPGKQNTGPAKYAIDGAACLSDAWPPPKDCSGTESSWTKQGQGVLTFDLGGVCKIWRHRVYFGNANSNQTFYLSANGKRMHNNSATRGDCWARQRFNTNYCMEEMRTANWRGQWADRSIDDPSHPDGPLSTRFIKLRAFTTNGWSEISKLEVEASCPVSDFTLVNIDLILRTRQQFGQNRLYKKKAYLSGNYNINKTDGHKRAVFSSAVLIRNLAL